MTITGDLIDELIIRRAGGKAAKLIRMSSRSWDQVISEVSESDGIWASDGEQRSFLGTPVRLVEGAEGVQLQ